MFKIYKDDDKYAIQIGGCGCCADTRYSKIHDYELDYYTAITKEEVEQMELYFKKQLELLKEVKKDVGL